MQVFKFDDFAGRADIELIGHNAGTYAFDLQGILKIIDRCDTKYITEYIFSECAIDDENMILLPNNGEAPIEFDYEANYNHFSKSNDSFRLVLRNCPKFDVTYTLFYDKGRNFLVREVFDETTIFIL